MTLCKRLGLVWLSFLCTHCSTILPASFSAAPKPEPSVISSAFEQGNEYAKDGLLREAIQSYRQELTKNAQNKAAHRNLGVVLVKAGDYEKAITHLEKSLPEFADNFETNFYLGEAYRAQEKYAEAIFRYKRANEIKPSDERALKSLSWSYYKIRYYSEALKTANQLRKITPNDVQTQIIIARALTKLERPEKALQVLERTQQAASREDVPYIKSVVGDVYRKMDNCPKALEAYREALKDQPALAGALVGLGQCMIESSTDIPTAISYLERAVRIKPRMAEGLFLLGKAYEKTDREKSLKYYGQFRRHAGSDPEFLSYLPEVKSRTDSLQKQVDNKTIEEATQNINNSTTPAASNKHNSNENMKN